VLELRLEGTQRATLEMKIVLQYLIIRLGMTRTVSDDGSEICTVMIMMILG
jgi:hypothetical protein